jgi:hypothetical protein
LLRNSALLFLLFSSLNAQAQSSGNGNCGTLDPTEAEQQALPWYGNPNYLDNYLSSITNAYSGNGTTIQAVEDNVRHRIPIHLAFVGL